ncbi:hypothetical protein EPUL_004686, partial [Erysiphe pulchra]
MKKTLLLCFIHGFKGGDSTFGSFPEYLKVIVKNALPNINVRALVYPKYETRGDLEECVKEFKEWLRLLENVIDLEVKNESDSPMVNPSVRVILIGHSMGGIVAADTALSIALDKPINCSSSQIDPNPSTLNTMIFPFVQGILAFDTPYLGVSPSLLAHLTPPKSTLTQLSDLSNILIASRISKSKKESDPSNNIDASKSCKNKTPQSWTKIAAIAGTSLALAAGGATAAYLNRESITQSWSWVGSHFKFVSCLMKREELQKRCRAIASLNSELSIGFGNLYTCLGKKGVEKSISGTRTFCIIPETENVEFWHKTVNDNAVDEINAHISMFFPQKNPVKGYYAMSQKAKSLIIQWTTDE